MSKFWPVHCFHDPDVTRIKTRIPSDHNIALENCFFRFIVQELLVRFMGLDMIIFDVEAVFPYLDKDLIWFKYSSFIDNSYEGG